jgi:Family of unknown function (DUF5906)
MLRIYGESGLMPSKAEQVLGRFNDALRGKSFIFLDEVLFAGNLADADKIKALATKESEAIETKGLPIVSYPIGVNLWLASNHDNAAHIEEFDRRYWALEASPCHADDADYFNALNHEIENGGLEAFAHFLLTRDVSNLLPWRDVPKDNATKDAMIRLSINPFDARKWIEDCCAAEQLIGRRKPFEKDIYGKSIIPENIEWLEWREGDEYAFADLCAAYVEWQKTVKSPVSPVPTKAGNLGEILNKAGITVKRTGHSRDRVRYIGP